jgi:acetate kinase
MKYLIVNRGSASEKYAIYTKEECLAFLHLEKAEAASEYTSTLFMAGNKEENSITNKEFEKSLDYALAVFIKHGVISTKNDISGIGIRIVAPGKHFQDDKVIDGIYEQEIRKVLREAPLHLLPTYEMILLLKKVFRDIPIVGISDSDFHDTIPNYAKYYALPFEDTEKHQIERYGYHGISVESILNKLKGEGPLPDKMIICHIGSGVSVTAVKAGKSIENSMGFTPLEGVMMATRGGDIDPGVVAIIADTFGLFKIRKLKEYLNKKCGLLGVSGQSSDVRNLIKLENGGDMRSKLALDMYVYRLQKYIGSYFVALGGLDAIIFTATVGERSFIIRERICQGLESLGVKIDQEKNNQSEGVDALISLPESKVKVLVRKTDEMGQIARDTISTLNF